MVATLKLLVMLYGGIGGWLGIAAAVYLYRIRRAPSHPAAVLGIFAMGFTMVMGTLLITELFSPYNPHAPLGILVMTYTLLIMAELALIAAHTHPSIYVNIHEWALERPQFTHARIEPESANPQTTLPEHTTGQPTRNTDGGQTPSTTEGDGHPEDEDAIGEGDDADGVDVDERDAAGGADE